jgi:hypothetical protein
MVESKHQRSIDSVTRKWAIIAGVCTSPIFIFFVYLGDPGRGMAAWVSAGAISAAARFLWDLKDRAWYWATIVVIVLLHVPLILLVPWPLRRWSYVQLLPIGLLDFALAYGIIRLVERVIEGNRKRNPVV